MPVHADTLSSLASQYTLGMSSIRGRRVQRLLKREFAGADEVLLVKLRSGAPAVLGRSTTGAAFCATDGRGRYAAVFKWLHDSARALETHFDLLKDSLPVLASRSVLHAAGPGPVGGHLSAILGVAECLHSVQVK